MANTPNHLISASPKLQALLPTENDHIDQDRASGVLPGVVIGNLLGLRFEGRHQSQIAAMHPEGVREFPRLRTREFDDDVAQTLELAHLLAEAGSRSNDELARALAGRLVHWALTNGKGMGNLTHSVMHRLLAGEPPLDAARDESRDLRHAPNGALMRCSPVAMACWNRPADLVRISALTAAVTHAAPLCQISCILLNAVTARLLCGKKPRMAELLDAIEADTGHNLLAKARTDIPTDVFEALRNGQALPDSTHWLHGDQGLIGHTLLALQCGLWAAETPLDFEEAIVALTHAGGDTDTNGAIAGAVLGARYGRANIPDRWLENIDDNGYFNGYFHWLTGLLLAAGELQEHA